MWNTAEDFNNLYLIDYIYPSWQQLISLSYFLFFSGICGIILNYRNFLITMLCIELMYLGSTMFYIFISLIYNNNTSQLYALLLIILAASESAVGLGIIIVLYRYGRSILLDTYQFLKG